jgi:hypothetical protein
MDKINFTSAKYVAIDGTNVSIIVVIDGITSSVPLDPANRHYAEIQRQVKAGDLTIADAD